MSSPATLHRTQPVALIRSGRSPIVKGAIVYLGAGDGQGLPEYSGAQRMILVEPDPEQARELRRLAKSDGRVVVITAAVSAVAGINRLKRFRLRTLNSLRAPTGLHELYPGLRLQDEIEVEAVTPSNLIDAHGLRVQQDNWLIIDTPGEEAAIVQSLRDGGDLAVFDRIDLCCGVRDHYAGAESATAVLRMLEEEGYDIESRDDSADPERPRWSLRRNPLRLQNMELREQLAEAIDTQESLSHQLTEALDELTRIKTAAENLQIQRVEEVRKLAEEHRAEVDDLKRERDEWIELAAQREQKIMEMNQARDDQAQRFATLEALVGELAREKSAALEAQLGMARELGEIRIEFERLRALEIDLSGQLSSREATIDRLTGERDAALAEVANLGRQIEFIRAQATRETEAFQGRLSEAVANAERLGQLLAERESEAGAADTEIRTLRAEMEKRDAQIADLSRKLEEHAKAIAVREAEIQGIRYDLSVAIRLQSMREADLRDLQSSYAALLHEKTERDELLAELSSRLEIVAGYLSRSK